MRGEQLSVPASDDQKVHAVLTDPASRADPSFTFPAMPARDNWAALREVLVLEEALRANRYKLDADLGGLGLPHYWTQVLRLFEVYRRLYHDEPVTAELITALDPIYQHLLKGRWGPRLPAPKVVR